MGQNLYEERPMNQNPAEHLSLITILASILVPIAIAVASYVFANLNKDIKAAETQAHENSEKLLAAIKDSETRMVAARQEMEARLASAQASQEERMRSHIRDVEARAIAKAKEAEERADKGDNLILTLVNSQYGEVRSRLDELAKDVRALRCMNIESNATVGG
jgi:hypothetical protein